MLKSSANDFNRPCHRENEREVSIEVAALTIGNETQGGFCRLNHMLDPDLVLRRHIARGPLESHRHGNVG